MKTGTLMRSVTGYLILSLKLSGTVSITILHFCFCINLFHSNTSSLVNPHYMGTQIGLEKFRDHNWYTVRAGNPVIIPPVYRVLISHPHYFHPIHQCFFVQLNGRGINNAVPSGMSVRSAELCTPPAVTCPCPRHFEACRQVA